MAERPGGARSLRRQLTERSCSDWPVGRATRLLRQAVFRAVSQKFLENNRKWLALAMVCLSSRSDCWCSLGRR
jgi:hypothetical protein